MTRRLAALALVLVAWGPAAGAASLTLTDTQRQEAIRVGQRSVTSEVFGGEWRVENAAGDSASVITPFHRIALAARHAAFKNEPLKAQDQDRMLQDLRDKLMFWVQLRGGSEDFARRLAPRLLVGDREIQPTIVQNERTALREEGGRYVARCVYWFPARDVGGTARVALVVRTPDQDEVARFDVDLGKMR